MKHNRLTGEVDGTPQEISDFYNNMGFNADDLFQPKSKNRYCVLPALCFLISCVVIIILDPEKVSNKLFTIEIIISILLLIWFCIVIQHYYKQWIATMIVAIGCLVILLLSSKQITIKTISNMSQDAAQSWLKGDDKKESK
ncbi:hypothetical protein [Leclercia adecarboxylata]|uniref:hypothetical protein n=1 Tax=Leclercia adecarboxylata TaxID=83655 RepID=UPI00254B123D|nr:hypothetical protein [Leclercia adecarboxylata]